MKTPTRISRSTQRRKFLNLAIDNLTKEELIQNLMADGGVLFTPNADHLVKLQHDVDFYRAYQAADFRVCDGRILMWMMAIVGQGVKEKVSGSDFFPYFYNYHRQNEKVNIFLLGAAEGVAEKAQRVINTKVGREIIVETYSPYFGFEQDDYEGKHIVDLVNRSSANVLAVGIGSPKQEIWIHKYRHQFKNIDIILGIGATIDFEAGNKKRAPKWVSYCGLEAPYRLLQEPQRLWRRYLVENPSIFWLALQQMLKLYRDPFAKR